MLRGDRGRSFVLRRGAPKTEGALPARKKLIGIVFPAGGREPVEVLLYELRKRHPPLSRGRLRPLNLFGANRKG